MIKLLNNKLDFKLDLGIVGTTEERDISLERECLAHKFLHNYGTL